MASKHELRISAQYSSEGEFWKAEVLQDGHVIASADRLSSSMKAREAGEYLSFGLRDNWSLTSAPSDRAIAASVPVVKSEIAAEFSADNSDGYMSPKRFLRMIFGAIRREQVRDFLHEDATRPDVDASDLGRYWTLKAVWPEEKGSKVTEHRNSPPRKVIPGLRYVILALDDAKMLAQRIRFPESIQPRRINDVLERLDAETGADMEDIVALLKRLDNWSARKLGRRLARLVDRANAGRTDGEAQPGE